MPQSGEETALCHRSKRCSVQSIFPKCLARYSTLPIPATFDIRFGRAADEIVIQAKDDEVELIVMGSHGRSGISHLLVGSVAESVVRHAPCPVLVVRQ